MGWIEKYESSLSPAQKRNWDRRIRMNRIRFRLNNWFPWTRWPILIVVYVFWELVIEEGLKTMILSKFDGMKFSFLNDGMRPTLWHTWQQITHNHGKYTGIYIGKPPRNRAEAELWEAKWEQERAQEIVDEGIFV